jgi:uncharacterized protein (TIGR02453 family)
MSAPTFDLPPFPGFREEGLQFLRDLKQNNSRDWFKPRKSVLDDEILWPMRCLMHQLSHDASRHQIPLSADPDGSIFRIYRDVRFSKNKAPYKTHVGAVLTPGGHKKDPGGCYIHIEPGQSYIAQGFWHPDGKHLRKWRDHIQQYPDLFVDLMRSMESDGLTPESDEKLKRIPRGYDLPEDHPASDYIRWKSFYAVRYVDDADLLAPQFADIGLDVMKKAKPLIELGLRIYGEDAGSKTF